MRVSSKSKIRVFFPLFLSLYYGRRYASLSLEYGYDYDSSAIMTTSSFSSSYIFGHSS
jgi:hypothetical protein